MATAFGALCTDFYINSKLGVKLDLPGQRDTVMDFFQRVRESAPKMTRFKRYQGELALESPEKEGRSQWAALRKTSVRTGSVNPDTMEEGLSLHTTVMRLAPYYLSVSALDIDHLEVVFGFDLEARGNHNEMVYDAFYAGTPLAELVGEEASVTPIDLQPFVGMTLNERCDVQAFFEVKTRTSVREARTRRWGEQPISVYLTVRKTGPLEKVDELPDLFNKLAKRAEELAESRAIPHLITPLRQAIASGA